MSVLGIDLGRHYGRVGWLGPDGAPVTAGPVRLGQPVQTGPELARLAGLAPDDPAGGRRQVSLSLPASGAGEMALRRAAESAGLAVAHAVPAAVAAALHYRALTEGAQSTVLVCDQGAASLDLTVLTVSSDRTVRITDTASHPLGGDDWDAALAPELLRQITAAHPDAPGAAGQDAALADIAAQLRQGLDGHDSLRRRYTWHGLDCELALDRDELARLTAPQRERAEQAIVAMLGTAAQLPGGPPSALLLAGGLFATPGRAAALEQRTGRYVRCASPELAVVRGLVLLADFGVLRVLSVRQATQPPPKARPRTAAASPGARQDPEPTVRTPYPSPQPAHTPAPDPHSVRPPDPDPRPVRPPDPDPRPATPPKEFRTAPDPAPQPHPETAREPAAARRPTTAAPQPESEPRPTQAPEPAEPAESAAQEPQPAQARQAPQASQPPWQDAATVSSAALWAAVPVDQLQAIRRDDHLLVLWAWPDESLRARVRWRVEGSSGARPLDSGDLHCARRRYEHDGGLDLVVGRGAVTLTVEALVPAPVPGPEGAASLQVPAEAPVVRYQPAVRRRLAGRVATVSFESDSDCELPAQRIVYATGRFRPMSANEGRVLHEVPARRLAVGTPHTVEFAFPATRGPSWLVCFPAVPDDDPALPDVRPVALHRLKVT